MIATWWSEDVLGNETTKEKGAQRVRTEYRGMRDTGIFPAIGPITDAVGSGKHDGPGRQPRHKAAASVQLPIGGDIATTKPVACNCGGRASTPGRIGSSYRLKNLLL